MRSSVVLAVGLSLVDSSTARSTSTKREVQQARTGRFGLSWLTKLMSRASVVPRQDDDTCIIDPYYNFVYNSTFGENVCRALLTYPNQTITVDYTPVSTIITTYTTRVKTETSIVRETPYTTVTVTANAAEKRAAYTTNAPRDVQIVDVFNMFQRENVVASDESPDAMSSAFSSACECQTYAGSTVTVTYTAAASIVTLSAFNQAATTVLETRTAALETRTTTVRPEGSQPDPAEVSTTDGSSATKVSATDFGGIPMSMPSIESTTTEAAPSADPTAPAFTCPEDNNSIVSQLVGAMRYDYLILCDTEATDPDFYGLLNYPSFSECAAACSVANTRLQSPVCQGISYYAKANSDGYNCLLKSSINSTAPAAGVNSGLLRRIAVGLSSSDSAGTSTESAPFAGETPARNQSELSSSASAALVNSTTSIGVTAPPSVIVPSSRLVPGKTSYSTYISAGQTYSTGTAFSSYWTSGGSWYYTYYTSYSLAWSTATTVYAASETGSTIANTTNSESSTGNGASGNHWTVTTTNTTSYFPEGFNVTQVISNVTYDATGAEITSSATTNYYSYSTSAANGGMGGGGSGGDAGPITSSEGSSGASSFFTGGAIATSAPTVLSTAVVSTYGTAYGTGFAISGGGGGALGGSSIANSSVVSSSGALLTRISSTALASASRDESGGAGSGAPVPISSTMVLTGTSGESGTAGSGALPSSEIPFTDSERPRSGTYATSSQSLPASTATMLESSASRSVSASFGSIPTNSSNASSAQASGSGGTSSGFVPPPGSSLSGVSSTSGGLGLSNSTEAPSTVSSSSMPYTASVLSQSSTQSTIPVIRANTSSSVIVANSSSGTASFTEYIPYPQYSAPGETPDVSLSISSGVTFTATNNDRTRLPSSSRSSRLLTTVRPSTSRPNVSSGSSWTGNSSTPAITSSNSSETGLTSVAPPSTFPSASLTFPGGFNSSNSSDVPFTNTGDDRTRRPSSTRAESTVTEQTQSGTTPGVTLNPTTVSSCAINYQGTTTIFATVTEYGCYSDCPPAQPHGYGPPSYG